MKPTYVRIAVILGAIVAAAAPLSPAFVDRVYSMRAYAAVQRVLTTASNAAPFSLFDLLLLAVAAAWIALGWRDVRRCAAWTGAGAKVLGRTVVWSAAVYLLFVATWGLNYRRLALREKLPYDQSAVTPDAVVAAAHASVSRLNGLYGIAHASGWPPAGAIDPQLAAAFARALRDTNLDASTVPGRPKATWLDWYFRRSGTDGMTDPFFLETLVSTSVLPFERAFVVAHEWSHLAGVGDEGEANFVGWLTCMRGGPSAQYSGALFLYRELGAVMPARDRAALGSTLAAGPRADLLAIRDRATREISPRLSAAGWRIYDSYLRANHVEAGAASYGEVVQLVLGLRLEQAP